MASAACLCCGLRSSEEFNPPTSPFEAFLNTNICPPDCDTDLIEEIITSTDAVVQRVDDAIALAYLHIAKLSASRDRLSNFTHRHRCLLAPIKRLPAEVLCIIFAECVAADCLIEDEASTYVPSTSSSYSDSDVDFEDLYESASDSESVSRLYAIAEAFGDSMDRDFICSDISATSESSQCTREAMVTEYSPWVLTRVCGLWRAVALSFPPLWSKISINFGAGFSIGRDSSLMLVKRQLELAKSYPLSIVFTCVRDTPECGRFMDAIISHSDYWEQADICVPRNELARLVEARGQFGRLHRLRLDAPFVVSNPPDPFIAFDIAPALSSLTCRHGMLANPPWGQLTHLQFETGPTGVVTLLGLAQNLVDCRLGVVDEDNPGQDVTQSNQSIHLRNLMSWHLGLTRPEYAEILTRLVCPVLDVFSLTTHSYVPELWSDTSLHTTPLIHFLQRSQCSNVNFIGPHGSVVPIPVGVIEAMGAAREMGLDAHCYLHRQARTLEMDEAISSLICHPGQVPLLAHLRSLTLRVSSSRLHDVLDMLESRWRCQFDVPILAMSSAVETKGSRLQKCIVELWEMCDSSGLNTLSDYSVSRIVRLRHEGMELRFTSCRLDRS